MQARAFCRSTTCRGDRCERDENGCPVVRATTTDPESEPLSLPLYWPTSCVGFALQKDLTSKLDPIKVREAITASFEAWATATCADGNPPSLSFVQSNDTLCMAPPYYDDKGPNINVILFRDDDFPYRDEDNTLGKTTVTYDKNTGAILDADIEINSAFNEVTVSDKRIVYDLRSIMTHELGHFIGIAHTRVPGATMLFEYATGDTEFRTLEPDDIDAVCTIYPPDRTAACTREPHGGLDLCEPAAADEGCSAGPGPRGPIRGGAAAALALALAVGARHARRRARSCSSPGSSRSPS
ncbi:MAG: matrixin family metalloprotease [Myxococcales bacterium]|nr:MAG: matrixin family metalloprotease [Myxococcales bacterium]